MSIVDEVSNPGESLSLTPAWCLRQPLDDTMGAADRTLLRAMLVATGGAIRVEGAERLRALADPVIFALTHHNSYEALVAPAALLALRNGRPVRFLVDWMYLFLPLVGRLLRRARPIAVYRKPARWRFRDATRRHGLEGPTASDRALEALAAGTSVGIYPEGRRNPDPWKLGRVRRGAAALAVASGAGLVPIGIEFPARQRLGRQPRFGKVVLRVGETLTPPASRRREDAPELSARLESALAHLARKSTHE